jgi:hypothetical protein
MEQHYEQNQRQLKDVLKYYEIALGLFVLEVALGVVRVI